MWYRVLQRVKLANNKATILSRVALDQIIFTPINLTLFLSTMAFLEGFPSKSIVAAPKATDDSKLVSKVETESKGAKKRIEERLNSTFYTAFTKNLMVWPWVQLANFSVVPLEHRVLVVNVVALGWNCYMSYLNSKGVDEDDGEKSE
jgi:protein Mpv17